MAVHVTDLSVQHRQQEEASDFQPKRANGTLTRRSVKWLLHQTFRSPGKLEAKRLNHEADRSYGLQLNCSAIQYALAPGSLLIATGAVYPTHLWSPLQNLLTPRARVVA